MRCRAGARAGMAGGYVSQVNVRDKVAGFIVQLAAMSDRWDRDASPALVRCRNGLGRSADPKVVAMRQAVLEKCMAYKGPSPTQGQPRTPPPSAHTPVSHTHILSAAAKAAAALGSPW